MLFVIYDDEMEWLCQGARRFGRAGWPSDHIIFHLHNRYYGTIQSFRLHLCRFHCPTPTWNTEI